jgi:uncharacterized protein with PQ loop repeat
MNYLSITFTNTEIVGYIASLMVLISFLMKEMKTLRILNTIGCAFFVAYGFMLQISIPIIGINVYYLRKNS